MLNPHASEFQPTPLGQQQGSVQPSSNHPKTSRSGKKPLTQNDRKKAPAAAKDNDKDNSKPLNAKSSADASKKKKQASSSNVKQKPRRRSSGPASNQPLSLVHQDIDTLAPTSFITLDHNIHPLHLVPGAVPTLSHGFDRYVAWIERCLREHETVTIVGMVPTLPDLITLVGMVQLKGLGYHQEFATFTLEENSRAPISGIQVKLHRY
ncbi:hypothetical protein DM01DRAFT_1336600 [Hesseltinella vesiculosa]|uniref:Uncharacterized protein n=1 Tax=Hesseltinella vesiculosa TaxID=101127 RepID=A0A1X2GGW8_9FUNG|nr:hypothetical protein DM01DRAFT_1336600 [Hesseltinella vesiculosa]